MMYKNTKKKSTLWIDAEDLEIWPRKQTSKSYHDENAENVQFRFFMNIYMFGIISSGLYEVDISDYTHDKFKWCPRMYLDTYKQPFWKILIFNLFSTHFCGKNGKKRIKNYNGLSEGGRTVFSSPLNCSRWVDIVSAQVYQNRTKNE